jgi:hypothetical protein
MCFQEKCKLAGSTAKEARHVEGLKLRVFINIGIQKKTGKVEELINFMNII